MPRHMRVPNSSFVCTFGGSVSEIAEIFIHLNLSRLSVVSLLRVGWVVGAWDLSLIYWLICFWWFVRSPVSLLLWFLSLYVSI